MSVNEIYLALKAVIEKDGKILILKRSKEEDCFKEMWDIPGGGINFGEMPEEALKREVKEETGLEIEVIKPVRIWSFFKNNGRTQVVGVTLLCKYKGGEVKLSREHTKFRWISPEEIEKYNVHEGIKKDIKACFNLNL
jgi:8-oxo-dGTP diphosphatase